MNKGLGNLGGMARAMQQVQKLQEDLQRAQEEAAERTAEATAGGGVVRAVANGRHQIVSLHIDPAAAEDLEMLQDLVIVACNEALRQAEAGVAAEMARRTADLTKMLGIRLPGMP